MDRGGNALSSGCAIVVIFFAVIGFFFTVIQVFRLIGGE